MNVLFICSRNHWRSLTAEKMFSGRAGLSVRSAGTAENARIKVNNEHINWADIIFVMEQKHHDILLERFPSTMETKKVINLNIPDDYHYMDTELEELLQQVNEFI